MECAVVLVHAMKVCSQMLLRFAVRKLPYSLNRTLAGPWSKSGRSGKRINILLLPSFEPGTVQPCGANHRFMPNHYSDSFLAALFARVS